MSLENCYVQAQIDLLELHLALAGDDPKRSGDFETTYKTKSGQEIAVKRSPDGKFANKNGGSSEVVNRSVLPKSARLEDPDYKTLAQADEALAKTSEKFQAQLRTLMFDSELSKGIAETVKSIVDKIGDPNLAAGFNLGQRINAELAKKPFSEFGRTITDKFAEFRKELPQKTDDLKKEIVRIAKDPNTSIIVTAGALMALAGCLHLSAVATVWRAGAIGASVDGTAFTKNILAAVLASRAGRIILARTKINAAVENDRLRQEILAKKEQSDALTRQQQAQQAKDAETRRKILDELSKGMPRKPEDIKPNKPETLAGLPRININLTDKEEEFAADPKHREQLLTKAYNDKEFLKLAFTYKEAQGLALIASFTDKAIEKRFSKIMEQTDKAIDNRITAVIKDEIKRIQAIEAQ